MRLSEVMNENARPHRAGIVEDYLEEKDSRCTKSPACISDMNLIEHAWEVLISSLLASSKDHPRLSS